MAFPGGGRYGGMGGGMGGMSSLWHQQRSIGYLNEGGPGCLADPAAGLARATSVSGAIGARDGGDATGRRCGLDSAVVDSRPD